MMIPVIPGSHELIPESKSFDSGIKHVIPFFGDDSATFVTILNTLN